jgi:hypothetical protein
VFIDLLRGQTLDYLSQVIEEGIIFAYEDALSSGPTNIVTDLKSS